jgi:hypothetical protein
MSKRAYLIVGLMWAFSLIVVAAVTAGQAKLYRQLPEPKVLSGEDVGFRVEGMYGEQPTGTIVIRVNGKWVDVQEGAAPGVRRPSAEH